MNVDHQFSGAAEPAFFLAAGFRGRVVIFRAMRRFRPAAIYSRFVAEAGAGAFSASVGAAGLARKFARLRRRWFLFAGCFFYRVGAAAAYFVVSPDAVADGFATDDAMVVGGPDPAASAVRVRRGFLGEMREMTAAASQRPCATPSRKTECLVESTRRQIS